MKEKLEKMVMYLDSVFADDRNFNNLGTGIMSVSDTDLWDWPDEASELLYGTSWGPEYEVIKCLKDHGYDCYAGDKDSCGWLVGVIEKNGKELYFG